jgi:hypothetical protein
MLTRRALLRSTALVPVSVLVVSCAPAPSVTMTPNPVPQWLAALQAIGTIGLNAIPELKSAGLVGTGAAQATTIIQNVVSAASAISASSTATQGQSVLIQIEGDANALAPIIAPFLPLIPGGGVIGLIFAALPLIEAGVNLGVSLLSPKVTAMAAAVPTRVPMAGTGPVPPMTAQEAVNELIARAALHQ